MVSKAREESNIWLRHQTLDIKGHVISIGSGTGGDGEGEEYRNYFKNCLSYKTSELDFVYNCDIVADIRSMPQVCDESFDCVFCSGVLEHVDDFLGGLKEITRILKQDGILLLGLPFRQAIHMGPADYWRFTEHGIRYMLHDDYEILDLAPLDVSEQPGFPAAYWVKARKI